MFALQQCTGQLTFYDTYTSNKNYLYLLTTYNKKKFGIKNFIS